MSYFRSLNKSMYSALRSAIPALLVLLVVSCSPSGSPEFEADVLTIAELENNPSFWWFPLEHNLYEPDTALIRQISANFNPDRDSVFMYVKTSCSCPGTQILFPDVVRILGDAGVPESNMHMFGMRGKNDQHPYSGRFTITTLPTILFTRNGTVMSTITAIPTDSGLEEAILAALSP